MTDLRAKIDPPNEVPFDPPYNLKLTAVEQ